MRFGAFIYLAVLLMGCTVTPRIVRSPAPSYDGGSLNSGFIGFAESGSGIITSHARERYNALARVYGGRFLVPVRPDDGLTAGSVPATWLIDPEHLVKFQQMNRWDKSKPAEP